MSSPAEHGWMTHPAPELLALRMLAALRTLRPLATLEATAEPPLAAAASLDSRKHDRFMRESFRAAIAIARHARCSRSAGLSPAASTPRLPAACRQASLRSAI